MPIKWVVMLIFIYVILSLALIPLGNSAMDEQAAKDINTMAYFGIPTQQTAIGPLEYAKAPINYMVAIYHIMTRAFNGNPIFQGNAVIVGWLVMAPILGGFVFGLVVTFFQVFKYAIS